MAKDIIKVVHEAAKGLNKAGVMDAVTLRDFDALCLPPVKPYTAARDQAYSRAQQGQPGGSRLSQYQPIDGSEVGAGSEETDGPSLKLSS